MAYNLHVVRPSDFVRLDAHGRLDLACVDRGIDAALLDVRDLYSSDLRLADVYAMARAFHEMGFRHNHRLAVLHRYNAGEKAEFFATCAAERGWNVRAFEEFEEAIDWFATPPPGAGK